MLKSVETSSFGPTRLSLFDLKRLKPIELGTTGWHNAIGSGSNESYLTFHPDGERVAIFGQIDDRHSGPFHIEIWNLASAQRLAYYTIQHRDSIFAARESNRGHDAEKVWIRVRDGVDRNSAGELHCWNWNDGKKTSRPELPPSDQSERFQKTDGGIVFDRTAIGGTGTVTLENTADSPLKWSRTEYSKQRRYLHLMGDGINGVWNLTDGGKVLQFPEEHEFLMFDTSEAWCISETKDKQLGIWNLDSGELAHQFSPPWFDSLTSSGRIPLTTSQSFRIDLHPSGSILSLRNKSRLALWSVERNAPIREIDRPGHSAKITAVADHPPSQLVATGDAEGVIILWDRDNGRQVRILDAHDRQIARLEFAAGGDLFSLTTGGELAQIHGDGTFAWRLQANSAKFTRFTAYPAGRVLAVASDEGRLAFLDAQKGKSLGRISREASPINDFRFSPDGRLLAVATESGHVSLWTHAAETPRLKWNVGAPARCVCFTADGSQLLVATDKEIHFYDPDTGQKAWALTHAGSGVQALQAASSGDTIYLLDQTGVLQACGLRSLLETFAHFGLSGQETSKKTMTAVNLQSPETWVEFAKARELELKARRAEELKIAQSLVEAGKWAQAVAAYSQLLADQPHHAESLRGRGISLARLEESAAAVADLSKAIELKLVDPGLYFERGVAFTKLNKWKEAAADFSEALKGDPENLPVLKERAAAA